LPDPVDRLLGYVDFRKAILHGELAEYTCLLGTLLQEVYETHPLIREACAQGISENARHTHGVEPRRLPLWRRRQYPIGCC
jgi:TetR/AcrR family transcriptional repressor of nem operon